MCFLGRFPDVFGDSKGVIVQIPGQLDASA